MKNWKEEAQITLAANLYYEDVDTMLESQEIDIDHIIGIINAMAEFAEEACIEQKKICAKVMPELQILNSLD